jgi:Predicted integral membrane protein (DUF2269)
MSLYALALFAHLVGVLGLFITIALQWTSILRLRRAQTIAQVREWASLVGILSWLGPASGLLLLVAGMYMTATAWNMNTPWITVSFFALVFLSVLGMGVTLRRLRAIRRSAAEAASGPIPPAVQRQIHDPLLWTSAQVMGGTALGVVLLMTTKPNLAVSLLVLVAALILGVLSAQPWRRPRAAVVPAQEAHVG